MNCLEEAGGIWLLQDRALFLEISLFFSTSGSGWQSLSRPCWGFPNRESSPPSSTRVSPPHPPTPPHLLIIQGALAAGSQLLSSGSGTLCSKLCHFFSCIWGGQESECSEPRAFSPCFSYRFLEVQGGPQIPLLLPSLPSQLHSGYVLPRPTGGTQVQIRLPKGASLSQRESRHAAK